MKKVKIELGGEEIEDFKQFLYDSLENPLYDPYIIEYVLKQLEEEED
ncbi:MAG: hypothetical protein ACTSQY_00020 [Candidatus Odinarchaeia archaeon]|nr:MAG: hypothetical protein [Lokiarchaeota virus Fenrir Meg22_1012]URC17182.1 MAG: hypothetical protein [Lokiarchaeota virus Fenrir Meg22_1214]